MITFNKAPYIGTELDYIKQAVDSKHISGDGQFTKKCRNWLENFCGSPVLLTTSCTHALELAAMLEDIKPGDEVIMPSYTFVSTANAFVLRGATVVFVDIRPDTMNIDEKLIEAAITDKTRAIAPVHYAGVACEMDTIMDIARRHNLAVVEDAAQGVNAFYKGKPLGTIGDLGCFSFHETKNYSMGEGGALVINRPELYEPAEIFREKGTDRSRFFRGQVDKYTWVSEGSSYLPSDINAAYLWAQLEEADTINNKRLMLWNRYDQAFQPLKEKGLVDLPFIPDGIQHNAHMYYLKLRDLQQRSDFIAYMKDAGVQCIFHYIPLHSSTAGKKYGRFNGEDRYTTKESERIVRLPMYYEMTEEIQDQVIGSVFDYFKAERR
ncbi:MAG: dTDP-4-amino-4,6-dideoxygalactose transaminase [Eubacteriaceae bacterium]|jgi:dTDP-4-amino-4,6-dideoxygalactose transaminase